MNPIATIFQYELWRNVRRKGYLFATLGIPLLFLVAVLGYHGFQVVTADEDADQPTLLESLDFEAIEMAGVVDLADAFDAIPTDVQAYMNEYESIEAARKALQAEEIDVFYVVEEGFLETGEVTLHLPAFQITLFNSGPIEQLFYRTQTTNIDQRTIQRLRNPANFREFDLTESAETAIGQTADTESQQFWLVYLFFFVFFFAMTFTNNYLMRSVVEERENRLIEILMSAVRPVHLLTAKILAMSLLGILQLVAYVVGVMVTFLIARELSTFGWLNAVALNFDWSILPITLAYFILLYLVFAALFATIGSLSGSIREGSQYVGLFTLPVILPIYFFPVIQSNPDGVIALVLSYIPFTSPITVVARLLIDEVPLLQLGISFIILALTAAAAMWFSGRMFRVQTLLEGQGFSLGKLVRLFLNDDYAGGKPRNAT